MRLLTRILYPFAIIIVIASCEKIDGNGGPCPKVDSVYYSLDSFTKSLVKIYHTGDTIDFKNFSSGQEFHFKVQTPDSFFIYLKDPASIYYNCPGNDWFMEHYSIKLIPIVNNFSDINIETYYGRDIPMELFRITIDAGQYQCPAGFLPVPPSTEYIDSVYINNKVYRNVKQIGFGDVQPMNAYAYYSRTQGLIRFTLPTGEIFDLK